MAGDGWNKRIARGGAGAGEYERLVAGLRGTIRGCLDVIGFYKAIAHRDRSAMVAIEQVVEALVEFDERCEGGDVEGAVVQLRAFIRRYRSYGGG
jgi:hypothetical protein